MPYIKDENGRREKVRTGQEPVADPGDLNFFITMQCLEYLSKTEYRYADYNFVIGKLCDFEDQMFDVNDDFSKYTFLIDYAIKYYISNGEKDLKAVNKRKVHVKGAIRAASYELYRRMCAPYEDRKIIENGDVYPVDSSPIVCNSQ